MCSTFFCLDLSVGLGLRRGLRAEAVTLARLLAQPGGLSLSEMVLVIPGLWLPGITKATWQPGLIPDEVLPLPHKPHSMWSPPKEPCTGFWVERGKLESPSTDATVIR